MDMMQIVSVGSGILFGIGGVSAAVVKIAPKFMKYAHVASHSVLFINDLIAKMTPDISKGETKPTLTEDEVAVLWQDICDIKAAWAAKV